MNLEIEKSSNNSVSWLELFFDLVFVALVAQLTYHFAYHHHSIEDFLQVGLVGYMIFLAWIPTTANSNLRKNEDLVDILLVQVQMAAIMTMSLTLPEAFASNSVIFFGAMMCNGFVALLMTQRRYHLHPKQRPKTLNIWWGLFIASALWGLAGLFPTPYLYIVAGCALLLNITAPMTRGEGNRVTYLDMTHLLERLGLFLLMVMGEAVLVVALVNTAAKEFDLLRLSIVLCGLLIMIALWWIYFPYIDYKVQGKRAKSFQLMLHTHGFLYGSLILIAGGLKIIIDQPDAGIEKAWIFLAGLALMVITFNIIRSTLTLHPMEGVKYSLGYLIPLGVVSAVCIYWQWPAYIFIITTTVLTLIYAFQEYRAHFWKHITME